MTHHVNNEANRDLQPQEKKTVTEADMVAVLLRHAAITGDGIHMNRLFVIKIKITGQCFQVKCQESSIGFKNLAHLQSIEKRCKLVIKTHR